ncbi:hypothetical protein HMPREF1545_00688 [Oscillibacter sp. KLE 1728]|nr:hypothetical protein HMPREF1545_00688 [Oscillibacter sp. KLE 1728]ERK68340.1 hypothetical protein HMPREF1546_00126 [Oscillibacter sp. KLE 1745]
MRAYYFFRFSFVKWPAYCLYIVRDFLPLKLKEVLAMKESGYKSYEDLPLFLNAATVAKALGVSPSSGYELMHEPGFPVLKIGSRMVVPKEQFICWVDEHTGGGT